MREKREGEKGKGGKEKERNRIQTLHIMLQYKINIIERL